jgi:hypothetical protein
MTRVDILQGALEMLILKTLSHDPTPGRLKPSPGRLKPLGRKRGRV